MKCLSLWGGIMIPKFGYGKETKFSPTVVSTFNIKIIFSSEILNFR